MRNILLSFVVSAFVVVTAVNIPAHFLNINNWFSEVRFGSLALTDIQTTDQISAFPTVQNANNALIESAVNSIIGTTTVSTLTSAPSLVTIGTIGTGVWQGTTIDEVYGGTGLTSYTTGDILYASGATSLSKLGIGTEDQVLSVTAGGIPAWTTTPVNETLPYNWTGSSFLVQNLSASSTEANPLILNGVSYNLPPSDASASSSSLRSDGSGGLTWISTEWELLASTTLTSPASSITLSVPSATDYHVSFYSAGLASAGSYTLRFNGDTGSNYRWRFRQVDDSISRSTGGGSFQSINLTQSTTSPLYIDLDITSEAGRRKVVRWDGLLTSSSEASPYLNEGGGTWTNTTNTITSIIFTNDASVNFNAGASVKVWGRR